MTSLTFDDLPDLAATFGLPRASCAHVHVGYRGTLTARAEHAQRCLYLRRYAPHWNGREVQVTFELTWLRALHEAGLPVVRSVSAPHGAAFVHARTGHVVAAFEPVLGEPRFPLTFDEAFTLGQTLARVHTLPIDVPEGVFRYDAQTLLEEPWRYGAAVLEGDDLGEWTRLGQDLRAHLAALPITPLTFGSLHADVHQWNVHWDGQMPTLLDFALCGVGFRLFDLAAFLWPRRDATIEHAGVRAMCDAFVAGYDDVRPLLREEWAALHAFVQLRDLWEMRDFADWDAKFDPRRDVVGYLARFRAHAR